MTEPVRVLYVDEVPDIGGGANSMLQLLKFLDRERFRPYLMTPPGALADAARADGVTIVDHRFRKRYESWKLGRLEIPLNPYRLLYRLGDARAARRVIRREGIRLVHTNNLDSHLVGWFLHHLYRVPAIWHIRIMTWPRALYRMPWVARIVFVSRAARRNSLGRETDDPRAMAILNGLDFAPFEDPPDQRQAVRDELGIPPGALVVGTVGRLDPQKRHQHLIEAARRLQDRGLDAHFVIVGGEIENRGDTGSHHERLERLAADLGVAGRVHLTGDRRDVQRLAQAFDVFAFPAFRDSNPRSVLEAMALAKPVVASDSGGLPEMLDGGRVGVLYPPDDVEALTEALAGLLSDPERRRELGCAARERVRTEYTIQQHARRIEAVYDEVLGRAR